MIFEEVVLHNFGVYKGRHTVSLEVTPSRPIVLVGAMNGAGKTTFLDAMQLALYGKSARCTGRERVSYPDYLASMINRDADSSQGAGIEFAFRTRTDGNESKIRVIRTWHIRGQSVKESLEVTRDGIVDAVASERWAEFVEDLMPSQIADLFFFDGEKIEALADPTKSAALLRVGVNSLLGIDLVESLLKSLQQVERKRKASMSTQSDNTALDSLHSQAADLNGRRDSLRQHLGGYEVEADTARKNLGLAAENFKRIGGDLYNRREELMSERAALIARKTNCENRLRDLAAGLLPLSLAQTLVARAFEQAQLSRSSGDLKLLADEAEARDTALLHFLQTMPAGKGLMKALEGYLVADRQERYKAQQSQAFMPVGLLEQFRAEDLERDLRTSQDIYKELVDTKEMLATVERNLSAVPDETVVLGAQQRVDTLRADLARIEAQIFISKREENDLDSKLSRIQTQIDRELDRIGELQIGNDTSQRLQQHSSAARVTLAQFRDRLLASNIERLQLSITSCLQSLMRKRSLVKGVEISPVTFQISVIHPGGTSIPAHRLSAGERQLLAVATLWALSQSSGRQLPAVIDTPLSRLDSKHRETIVKNYFPRASHQVILLSTDEEVVGRYHDLLRPHIGRSYIIEHDEARKTSHFMEGYFQNQAHLEEIAA